MPTSGLQIGLLLRVTLTFDLLIPKVESLIPVLRGTLVPVCVKLVHTFSKYHVLKFGNRRENKRTDMLRT